MKVLLIWVPFKLEEIYGKLASSAPILPPLELAYAASYLRSQGHDVKLVDAHALELTLKDVEDIIKEYRPHLVGTTSNSPIFSFIYSVYSRALEVLSIAKEVDSGVHTFLTGYHPTLLPREVLSEKCVDFAIVGYAEEPLARLCDVLENKGNLRSVDGLGFKQDGEITVNKKAEFVKDLDVYPIPAFDLLPMDRYRFASDGPVPVKGISIRTSRGCVFDCHFCPAPGFGKRVSTHSPEYAVAMMDHLSQNYGYDQFQIHDDNFGVNPRWINQFCSLLVEHKSNYSWECYERFDLLNEEMLISMKEAGCNMVSLGVESGSEEVLKEVKGLMKERIESGMKMLKRLKIKSRLFFMIGQPAKTKGEVESVVRYALKLNPDVFVATISIPYPGSGFYEQMKDTEYIPDFRNKLIPVYEAPFDFPNFTKKYLDAMLRKAYRSFYLRPGYIFKRLRQIGSLKNIKYYLRGFKFILPRIK